MSVQVVLDNTYLHYAADPDEFLELDAAVIGESTSGPSETTLMSGGNSKRSSGKGLLIVINVKFSWCTRAQINQLREWAGATLYIRDPRGRLHKGGFSQKTMQVDEHGPTDTGDVTVAFEAVQEEVEGDELT